MCTCTASKCAAPDLPSSSTAPLLTAVDYAYLAGGRVGLWSDQAQITVDSFEVTAI